MLSKGERAFLDTGQDLKLRSISPSYRSVILSQIRRKAVEAISDIQVVLESPNFDPARKSEIKRSLFKLVRRGNTEEAPSFDFPEVSNG